VDDEAVDLSASSPISPSTRSGSWHSWRRTMAKKRKKTDFSEQDARQRQFREYLARREEERQRREREAVEQKRG
jgi:hypothetical protein